MSGQHKYAVAPDPPVSVIIPTYNRKRLVGRAINSVLAQTFRDFEVIVVDDGSTDGTSELDGSFGERVMFLAINHTGLPAAARNAGIRASRGKYIAFLDSDDQWSPDKLEIQVRCLEKCPEAGLTCGNALFIKGEESVDGDLYFRPGEVKGGRALKELIKNNFVITSTAMVRRSLLDRTGLLSEEPLLRALEDYDLWLRVVALSEVRYVDRPLAMYYDHPGSIRSKYPNAAYWQGLIAMLDHCAGMMRATGAGDNNAFSEIEKQRAVYERNLSAAARGHSQSSRIAGSLLAIPRDWLSYVRRALPHGNDRPSASPDGTANDAGWRVHLGCGERYLPGYINVHFLPAQHTVQREQDVDIYADITRLAFRPGTIDEVRSHHVFEHFDRVMALFLLIQWHSWLKEGGRVVIETPDLEACVRTFSTERSVDERMKAMRHVFGSHEAAWAVHCDGWYREKFELYLKSLGFDELQFDRSEWQGTHNIIVIGKKASPSRSLAQQMAASKSIMEKSMVDHSPSELKMLEVWMGRLNELLGVEK